METRPLGDTGQESSLMVFGALLLRDLEQPAANRAVELVLEHGVNHVDVAPMYGDAELKLGPKLREHREEFFLGCKTQERTYDGAKAELHRSLDRLGVDTIDLYQFHAVTDVDQIDTITRPDGALEAVREAREAGIVDHVGLTSHGHPDTILETIDRIDDLETVMFPMNYTVVGKDDSGSDYEAVLERCRAEGIGTLGIKAFAKRPWSDDVPARNRPYKTWYQPYDTQAEIDDCLNFALSQGLTATINPGDPKLLPMILDAAERYEELTAAERAELVERGSSRSSPVPTDD